MKNNEKKEDLLKELNTLAKKCEEEQILRDNEIKKNLLLSELFSCIKTFFTPLFLIAALLFILKNTNSTDTTYFSIKYFLQCLILFFSMLSLGVSAGCFKFTKKLKEDKYIKTYILDPEKNNNEINIPLTIKESKKKFISLGIKLLLFSLLLIIIYIFKF